MVLSYYLGVMFVDNSNEIQCFLDNICALRRKYHLTAEDIVSRMGVEPEELQLLENNVLPETLQVSFLECLSREFHIPIPDFFRPLDLQ